MKIREHLHRDNVVVLESNDQVLCISFPEDSREHLPHHQGDRPEFNSNIKQETQREILPHMRK